MFLLSITLQTEIHCLLPGGNFCTHNVILHEFHLKDSLCIVKTAKSTMDMTLRDFLNLSQGILWRSLSITVMDISHLIIQKLHVELSGTKCDSCYSARVFLKVTCTCMVMALYGLLNVLPLDDPLNMLLKTPEKDSGIWISF